MDKLSEHGILTREQVSKSLKVNLATLARWEKEDGFPARTIGNTTLYDVAALKDWIRNKPKE